MMQLGASTGLLGKIPGFKASPRRKSCSRHGHGPAGHMMSTPSPERGHSRRPNATRTGQGEAQAQRRPQGAQEGAPAQVGPISGISNQEVKLGGVTADTPGSRNRWQRAVCMGTGGARLRRWPVRRAHSMQVTRAQVSRDGRRRVAPAKCGLSTAK